MEGIILIYNAKDNGCSVKGGDGTPRHQVEKALNLSLSGFIDTLKGVTLENKRYNDGENFYDVHHDGEKIGEIKSYDIDKDEFSTYRRGGKVSQAKGREGARKVLHHYIITFFNIKSHWGRKEEINSQRLRNKFVLYVQSRLPVEIY
jgi:hypothetical protein